MSLKCIKRFSKTFRLFSEICRVPCCFQALQKSEGLIEGCFTVFFVSLVGCFYVVVVLVLFCLLFVAFWFLN